MWQIPDGGLVRTITEPVVDLLYHQRRVGLVLWHPTALNVLLTAGSDNQAVIWNVGTGEALVKIDCHPDQIYSACWDWNGSKLVTTCKDKKIRLINPRTGEVESEAYCHEGSKATQAIFLRHGLIFTTGYVSSVFFLIYAGITSNLKIDFSLEYFFYFSLDSIDLQSVNIHFERPMRSTNQLLWWNWTHQTVLCFHCTILIQI